MGGRGPGGRGTSRRWRGFVPLWKGLRCGWGGWPPASALGERSMGWAGLGVGLRNFLACGLGSNFFSEE